MSKQNTIISIVIALILFVGAFIYMQNNNTIDNGGNGNTIVEDEIDTSDWETFENQSVGYTFNYPSNKYSAKSTISSQGKASGTGLYVKDEDFNNAAVAFYSKTKDYSAAHGATSADVMGYKQDNDKFYFTGGYKTDKVIVPSTFIETSLGTALVINGADKNNEEVEIPEKQYIAILNLGDNDFTGIAIYGFGNSISYEEFLEVVKSLQSTNK